MPQNISRSRGVSSVEARGRGDSNSDFMMRGVGQAGQLSVLRRAQDAQLACWHDCSGTYLFALRLADPDLDSRRRPYLVGVVHIVDGDVELASTRPHGHRLDHQRLLLDGQVGGLGVGSAAQPGQATG